jgi:uncharacterized protein (TIGR03435 family)
MKPFLNQKRKLGAPFEPFLGLSGTSKRWICSAILAASATGALLAQTSPVPTFEVSVVKVNKSADTGSNSNSHNGQFRASNVTLANVLQYEAYDLPASRILGGPKWLNSERFDIEAKLDPAAWDRIYALPPAERRQQMEALFQRLLQDRFKLAAHWETRDLPVYAMVIAKKGPALQPSKEPEGQTGVSQRNGLLTVKGETLAQLADTLTQDLSQEIGRVVVDQTATPGRYDFVLNFTPATDKALPDADDTGPSIFTAIQEQLGLKLESTKAPVTVLIVDHAEMPSEN